MILDADLARLYGVSTGALNRAVTRNQQRFPDDFSFKLTKNEWEILKCQNGISSDPDDNLKSQSVISSPRHGGRRKLPSVFSEHGALMASTVLRSDDAIGSKAGGKRARSAARHTEFLLSRCGLKPASKDPKLKPGSRDDD